MQGANTKTNKYENKPFCNKGTYSLALYNVCMALRIYEKIVGEA